ncbi:MAG: hypothetical protein AAGP08_02255 [Pseudomonadota bacterium]
MRAFRILAPALVLLFNLPGTLAAEDSPSPQVAPYVVDVLDIQSTAFELSNFGPTCYGWVKAEQGDPARFISDTPPNDKDLGFTMTGSVDFTAVHSPRGKCEMRAPGYVEVRMVFETPVEVKVSCWLEGVHRNSFKTGNAYAWANIYSESTFGRDVDCFSQTPDGPFEGKTPFLEDQYKTRCIPAGTTTLTIYYEGLLQAVEGLNFYQVTTSSGQTSSARLEFRGAC